MKKFFTELLDWIYKKKCYCCSSSRECVPVCSSCYDSLDFNPPRADRIIDGVDIFIAGIYDKNLQKIIRGLKYHNKKDLAYYQAKFMYDYFQLLGFSGMFQVVPVPLHKKRQKQRHYNHMELVAAEFCRLSGLEPNFGLIKRIKHTKPQYKLTKKERMQNLADAFEVDKEKLLPYPVLLMDDICTSGATFESMIQELKKNGIENIKCFATTSPYS